MSNSLLVQGRRLTTEDILHIRRLIADHPDWSRRRLSQALCAEWDWRNASGRFKDMAARALLLKLNERRSIALPARRQFPSNRMAARPRPARLWDQTPVSGTLQSLGPLSLGEISKDALARAEFAAALSEFHYLGHRGTVGENLQYTVTDQSGRLLACLLFGSAAWKCRARDEFIGWTAEQRERRLTWITNNTRFLILRSVRVPHLASWILGRVMRRLSSDWEEKYGHPIALVETFVERERFAGTSYKAANWIRIGETTGRSRQDRHYRLHLPIKDVYVYPLRQDFRWELAS
jgi:hypothetical protein